MFVQCCVLKSHKIGIASMILCGIVLFYNFCGIGGSAKGESSLHIHPVKKLAGYIVSGAVFDDYNENGVQDAREPGVNGIVITAYNSTGRVVGTATTVTSKGVLGQYALSIANGIGPIRVQFSNFGVTSTIPELVGFQPGKHTGGTPVVFVNGTHTTNTVNLGIERPAEYCQNNPDMVTSCYVQGDQTRVGAHVVVRFPYNRTGSETINPPVPLANDTDVGTTWGLAYRRSSDDLFAAAYTKLLAGYKPGGSTGAIYRIHGADSTTPTVSTSPFVDLNALFGTNTAGADPHTATNNYDPDLSAYDAVGKIGLGGLALSEDESTLYAMNLANRSLYSIPIGAPPDSPTAPDASTITTTPVPIPTDCTVANDMRPFAVTFYRNLVYVGAVCSAESTITSSLPKGDASQLKAYVFAYTPGIGFDTSPVFETSLNYIRHCADGAFTHADTCAINGGAKWNPWQPDAKKTYPSTIHPQPMLTSIAFDNGDLILGLHDRYGDQTGHSISGVPESRTAGDDLRACLNIPGDLSAGWTLENNGTCGAITINAGKDNGKGPGNGEYYYQQYYYPFHDYTSGGGVDQIPGFPDFMSVGFDPGSVAFTGGIRTYSDTTGDETHYYEIYNSNQTPITFGKANGLGALVALCQSAPIEIGDRVWDDANGNGIQDAGEPGIANVTVNLYAVDGTTLLQTTTTDANGNYYFPISPYNKYVVKLDNPNDYTQGPLKDFLLASNNQDSAHIIDSKAILPVAGQAIESGNYPQMSISAHLPGYNDTTFDVGFVPSPDGIVTETVEGTATSYKVGQRVNYTLVGSTSADGGPVFEPTPLTITDPLPAGFSDLSASGKDWSIALSNLASPALMTATYTGAIPILPGTTLPAITLNGTLTTQALGDLSNSANLVLQGDKNNANNTASVKIHVKPALLDLSVGLRHASTSCMNIGDQITYILTVTNGTQGGSVPMGQPIMVMVVLPAGLSNVTLPSSSRNVKHSEESPWHITDRGTLLVASYSGSYPINEGSSLPPITINAILVAPVNGSLATHVLLTTSQESNIGSTTANDVLTICPAILTITKTHRGSDTFQVGQRVTYIIKVSNNPHAGPAFIGQPIVVTDMIPHGLAQIKATGIGWRMTMKANMITATYSGDYPIASGVQLPVLMVSGTLTNGASPIMRNGATLRTAVGDNVQVITSASRIFVRRATPPGLPPTGSDPRTSAIHDS